MGVDTNFVIHGVNNYDIIYSIIESISTEISPKAKFDPNGYYISFKFNGKNRNLFLCIGSKSDQHWDVIPKSWIPDHIWGSLGKNEDSIFIISTICSILDGYMDDDDCDDIGFHKIEKIKNVAERTVIRMAFK